MSKGKPKRILIAALAASAMISLSACDKNNAPDNNGTEPGSFINGEAGEAVTKPPGENYDNADNESTLYALGDTVTNFTAADVNMPRRASMEYDSELAEMFITAMHGSVNAWQADEKALEKYISGEAGGNIIVDNSNPDNIAAAADAIERALNEGRVARTDRLSDGTCVLDLDSRNENGEFVDGETYISARLAGAISDDGCFKFDLDLSYVSIRSDN